jgi:hypothetical protein
MSELEENYQYFKQRLIEEGFIEANPKRWVRPDKSDIRRYFFEHELLQHVDIKDTNVIADNFYQYWNDLDWYAKKTRIKSWKGRANTWIKNNEKYKRNDSQRFNGESAADKIAASIANRNR